MQFSRIFLLAIALVCIFVQSFAAPVTHSTLIAEETNLAKDLESMERQAEATPAVAISDPVV